MSSSPSPTSLSPSSPASPPPPSSAISSSSYAAPFPPQIQPLTGPCCLTTPPSSLLSRYHHHHHHHHHSSAGMGLSMITPSDLLCPPSFHYHSIPPAACPMVSAGYRFPPSMMMSASSCMPNGTNGSAAFSSISPTPPAPLPSSKGGIGGGTGGGGGGGGDGGGSGCGCGGAGANSGSSSSSSNGASTISLAAVSVPLSFYVGGGGVPSQAPVAAGAPAPTYSAYSPGPIHLDVSHEHTNTRQTDTHENVQSSLTHTPTTQTYGWTGPHFSPLAFTTPIPEPCDIISNTLSRRFRFGFSTLRNRGACNKSHNELKGHLLLPVGRSLKWSSTFVIFQFRSFTICFFLLAKPQSNQSDRWSS